MTETSKYWALVDLRYPAGDAEYAKAAKGEPYGEIAVKAGDALTNVPDKAVKAFLSMSRDVITTDPPKAPEKPQAKAVKT